MATGEPDFNAFGKFFRAGAAVGIFFLISIGYFQMFGDQVMSVMICWYEVIR